MAEMFKKTVLTIFILLLASLAVSQQVDNSKVPGVIIDDGIGGAHNQHDANYFTFHRIRDLSATDGLSSPNKSFSVKTGHSAESADKADKDTINLIACRGEYESAQIVIRSEKDVHNVAISVTDLRINASDDKDKYIYAENIQIRSLEKIEKWYDVLVPTKSVDVKAGEAKAVWVTVFVPRNLPAGVYSGQVTVKADGYNETIAVTLNAGEMLLSVTPAIPAVFGIYDRMFQEVYHLDKDCECLGREMDGWYQYLIKYRISPYFFDWLGKSMKHHSYPSPWEMDDPRTLEYLSDPRLSAFSIPYYGLDEKQLRQMLGYLKEKKLLDKGYFYLWDEPDEMAEYKHVAECAEQIHSITPEAKVLVTYTRGSKDGPYKDDLFAVPRLMRGSSQIFCMSIWAAHGDESRIKKIQQELAPGEEWWSYVCMGPGNPQPNLLLKMSPIQHRAVMWRTWKEGGTGFLYWAVNSYGKSGPSGMITFRERLPEGDGVLLYPGKAFGIEGPLASARLERFRDGFEDYEYLKAYAEKFGRDEAEKMLKLVYQGAISYTDSAEKIEMMRMKILEKM